ncbi:hypothetical protein DAPPUDRAFT_326325 [Daphnia pulex]|uniref:Uncharacterized protein n=1 Tax=Daphnia pulex TaxID=6669 RepID=E9H7E0_DAPPU|nr:hypothetical protein DAPPUDRAFT_326325 [Daphnia pulex]|eukprot:EFX72382.1 hypothetical protein DAPPUDRAFT_326325 [Daphnia pulex]
MIKGMLILFVFVAVCVLLVSAQHEYTENYPIINYRITRFSRDVESQMMAKRNRFPGWLYS